MGEALIVRRGTPPEPELFIEPGLIVEWFGLSSGIPEGWALCDGTNGTPNLIDKFIIGAGSTYNIGNTGGSSDVILPEHNHTLTVSTSGSHTHTTGVARGNIFNAGSGALATPDASGTNATSTNDFSHSHTVSISTVGESGENKNLPPYYTLFYIIKVEVA